MLRRLLVPFLLPLFLLVPLLAATTVSAETLSPWWHLSSASTPTYLLPAQARNEVQQLTVAAGEGIYALELQHGGGLILLEVGETPEQVQELLEREFYGAGNVRVTGGPGAGSNPYEVYRIEFLKGLSDQPVAVAEVPEKLDKVKGVVSLTELTTGRSDGQIVVTAVNLGDASADPSIQPIVLADKLPAGLKAVAIEGFADEYVTANYNSPLECSLGSLSCTFTGKNNGGAIRVPPYYQVQMRISVNLKSGVEAGEINQASVTGGGVHAAATEQAIKLGEGPTPFGVNTYEMRPEEPGGTLDAQAGSHPFQLTTTIDFNETYEGRATNTGHPFGGSVPAMAKDLHFNLPPGLIGNPTPFAQCPLGAFLGGEEKNLCSAQTVVGVARVSLVLPRLSGAVPFAVPLFNIVPSIGEPARFGFLVHGVPVLLTTKLRTGSDYGVTVNVTNISQLPEFLGSEVTFWGVPGAQQHDISRDWTCLEREQLLAVGALTEAPCAPLGQSKSPPFLSMPPSCTGATQSTVEGDSWTEPLDDALLATASLPAMDGCNQLQFSPSIEVTPDGQAGSTPTGLAVKVRVPQDVSLNAEGLAEADVRDTTVALPVGMGLNPAGGDGLMACSEEQIALNAAGPSACPEASKVGLVKIKTPLLPNVLEGAAYLAAQNSNPFGSLVAIYVFAEDPVSGSRVKLAGEVVPDPVTGQLVSTFKNTPELPFETFELHFFGGARAPLSTPALCGAYTTTASIVPSSSEAAVDSTSTFNVVSGPDGSQCQDPLPFDPTLTAGTTNINAGGFTPLTTTIARADGNQDMQSVQLHFPAGLSGLLSGVELCQEPQASQGLCGPGSQIGETTVSAGVGSDPVSVTGGKVFITGPYNGTGPCKTSEPGCAPFGLSVVNPVKAGPFDLERDTSDPNQNPACDCVVVRAKIEVDLHTAALTVTTNASGPYSIPHLIDGIPVQIQKVNVLVNKQGFTFNPTSCTPTKITGAIGSTEGSSSAVSVPFQATNCASLKFAPKFAVATQGKTSKANGASLAVKLTYPQGSMGTYANIKQVKVELPKQLPSRLTTLQKACTAAQFNANPAGCPAASVIGHAKAITPLIPVPLEGPAYFVSNGGEAFPNLIMVLQGYGVTIDLVGDTFINKAGVTSSTFKTVPDAPVGSFELTLPEGKYSALAANGNLCTSKLTMPTEFVGQNGALLKQTTPISITGCAKTKALTRAQKLAKALKSCKGDKNKGKRQKCETTARKQYGPKAKKKSGGKKAKR